LATSHQIKMTVFAVTCVNYSVKPFYIMASPEAWTR